MFKTIGYKTYIVFMVFCLVGLLWAIFVLPEVSRAHSPAPWY